MSLRRKLLYLAGSDNDFESVSALKKLKHLLKKQGSSWNEFVSDLIMDSGPGSTVVSDFEFEVDDPVEAEMAQKADVIYEQHAKKDAENEEAIEKLRRTSRAKTESKTTGDLKNRNRNKFDKGFV